MTEKLNSEPVSSEEIIATLRKRGFGYDVHKLEITCAGVRAKLYRTASDAMNDIKNLGQTTIRYSSPFVAIFYDMPLTHYSLETLADAEHLHGICESGGIPIQEFFSGSSTENNLIDIERVSNLLRRVGRFIKSETTRGPE